MILNYVFILQLRHAKASLIRTMATDMATMEVMHWKELLSTTTATMDSFLREMKEEYVKAMGHGLVKSLLVVSVLLTVLFLY